MKNVLLFAFVGIFSISCTTSDSYKFEYKVFKLKMSTQDAHSIGYQNTDDGPDITVNSILVNNGEIFLLDRYYGNVKRIDILSGEDSTILMTNDAKWLTDIACLGEKIVISTDLPNIYFFDRQFKFLGTVDLEKGEKYFIRSHHDSLEVYNMISRTHTVLTENQIPIETSEDYVNTFDRASLRLSYSYVKLDSNEFISFSSGDKIHLRTRRPDDLKIGSEGVNMDFDGENLVYYELDTLNMHLVLHVYSKHE